jgi:hypothetical protein
MSKAGSAAAVRILNGIATRQTQAILAGMNITTNPAVPANGDEVSSWIELNEVSKGLLAAFVAGAEWAGDQ